MSISGFAECRTYQFCFKNQTSLYLDHDGRRVLADVEGDGHFLLSQTPEEVDVWIDGVLGREGSGRFSESLLVTSSQVGESRISVQCGSAEPFDGPIQVCREFIGCGWIVGSDALTHVDGEYEGWQGMKQDFPIPVFWRASGENLRVVSLPIRYNKLAELRMNEPETLERFNWKVKNPSRLFDLTSEMPGEGIIEGQVMSHLNGSSIRIEKPVGCEGILIRRRFDAFHGRQRARVTVNGKHVGWWFEPTEDRKQRWRWDHFGFGTSVGDESLTIVIDPAAGTPLWSVSRYEIWGLFPVD